MDHDVDVFRGLGQFECFAQVDAGAVEVTAESGALESEDVPGGVRGEAERLVYLAEVVADHGGVAFECPGAEWGFFPGIVDSYRLVVFRFERDFLGCRCQRERHDGPEYMFFEVHCFGYGGLVNGKRVEQRTGFAVFDGDADTFDAEG